jgi:hypothetical protein
MAAPQSRYRQPKQLDAGDLQPEISSFGLHLAAEGKAARTIRTYMEAVAWFAAAHLLREAGRTGWEQVGKHDVQQWMVRLLDRYSAAPRTPATSSARCSSSSSGWPPRRRSVTRWPG